MNLLLLQQCVRPVDPIKDKDLPRFSHSKLEVYENCIARYNLQYNQKKRSNDTTLSLEIGTLTHKILEEKGAKKLVYTHVSMPMTAISDFRELGKTDKFFKDLADICDKNNGIWSAEAEKYLLANAKPI